MRLWRSPAARRVSVALAAAVLLPVATVACFDAKTFGEDVAALEPAHFVVRLESLGGPLTRASLTVQERWPQKPAVERKLSVNEMGVARFDSDARAVVLRSECDGFMSAHSVPLRGAAGGTYNVVLLHVPAVPLSGRVVNVQGEPVGGVPVTLRPSFQYSAYQVVPAQTLTGADGRFHSMAPPDVLGVCVADASVEGGETCIAHPHRGSGADAEVTFTVASAAKGLAQVSPSEVVVSGTSRVRTQQYGGPLLDAQLSEAPGPLHSSLIARTWAQTGSQIAVFESLIDSAGRFRAPQFAEGVGLVEVVRGSHRLSWVDPTGFGNLGVSGPRALSLFRSSGSPVLEKCDGVVQGVVEGRGAGKIYVGLTSLKAHHPRSADLWTVLPGPGTFQFEGVCVAAHSLFAVRPTDLQATFHHGVESGEQVALKLAPLSRVDAVWKDAPQTAHSNSLRLTVVPEDGLLIGRGSYGEFAFAPEGSYPCLEARRGGHLAYLREQVTAGGAPWYLADAGGVAISALVSSGVAGVTQWRVLLTPKVNQRDEVRPCGVAQALETPVSDAGVVAFNHVQSGVYQLSVLSSDKLCTVRRFSHGQLSKASRVLDVSVGASEVNLGEIFVDQCEAMR